jgi:anti-sigma factor RsiW
VHSVAALILLGPRIRRSRYARVVTQMPGQRPEVSCQEFVELVTDYLEGALAPDLVDVVERHLAACPHCVEYLAEIRQTMAALGQVPVQALSERTQLGLIAAFRDLRRP